MNCAEFEILLADYLDNALGAPERAALQAHASTCVGCRDLLNDAGGALSFLQRADAVEIPAGLITRIAYQAPTGRIRNTFERQSVFSRLIGQWLQPVLQPRLVMGMAMTVLSFAMLEKCTGVRVQHIEAADLNPVRIWGGVEDRTMRVKDRAVKYYENLRWVYEIEVRLRSLQDETETAPAEQPKQPAKDQKTRNGTNGVKKP